MDLMEMGMKVRNRCIWLRIGTRGRLLWTRKWTSGFHKRWRIYWLAEWVLVSWECLCSMELVIFQIQCRNVNHSTVIFSLRWYGVKYNENICENNASCTAVSSSTHSTEFSGLYLVWWIVPYQTFYSWKMFHALKSERGQDSSLI
jgi:hypothetical protein